MLLAPGIPGVFHSMLSVPNLCLENAMACRVYRAVKLGFIKNPQITHLGISLRSTTVPDDESGHELVFKTPTLDKSRNMQVHVDITRTTDMELRDDRASGKRASLVAEGSDTYSRV
jgi:hypothetical protein